MPTTLVVAQRCYYPAPLIHCHDYAQVVLPECGRLDLVVGGRRGAVAGSAFAVVAPEVEHVCWADGPTRCLVVDLPPALLHEMGPLSERTPFRALDARTGALAHLLRVEAGTGGLADRLVAESLGRYAVRIFTALTDPAPAPTMPGPSARLLARRVRAYLDEHYRDDLSLAAIADIVGASIAHVQRSFRAETGSTIVAYVQDRRLAAATDLLRTTDLSVTEIAAATGVGTASYFGRLFARRHGTTPSRYRSAVWSGTDEYSRRS